jgi:hypothetical protein
VDDVVDGIGDFRSVCFNQIVHNKPIAFHVLISTCVNIHISDHPRHMLLVLGGLSGKLVLLVES